MFKGTTDTNIQKQLMIDRTILVNNLGNQVNMVKHTIQSKAESDRLIDETRVDISADTKNEYRNNYMDQEFMDIKQQKKQIMF